MLDFLYTLAPNLELLGEELWKCTIETLQMVFVSGIISFIFGIIFGVILIVTRPGGILRNKVIG